MQIEIKKIKATKSIMDQVQVVTGLEMENFTPSLSSVLGWYIKSLGKEKTKYILLKYEDNYRKIRFPEQLEKESKNVQIDNHGNRETHFFCVLKFGYRYSPWSFTFQKEEGKRNDFYNKMQAIIRLAREQGQFFI